MYMNHDPSHILIHSHPTYSQTQISSETNNSIGLEVLILLEGTVDIV